MDCDFIDNKNTMPSLKWSVTRNTGASAKKEVLVFFFIVWCILNLYANIEYKISFVDKIYLYMNTIF